MAKVFLTVKDEFTGDEHVREVGMFSEFFEGSEAYRVQCCNDWIEQRGNNQHDTLLSLVGYEVRA